MSPTIRHSGKGRNYGDNKKISGFQGLGEGNDHVHRQCTWDFEGSKNTLYDTVQVDTHHYTFVQTHRIM